MSKPFSVMTPRSADTIEAKPISLPTHIRVEKDGKDTRVYCSVSGAEVLGIGSVKLDLSDGKVGKGKLTFECEVTEVEIVDRQLNLLK